MESFLKPRHVLRTRARSLCAKGLITRCNGNPLVDECTGARHADGRLGGLDSEHCLEGIPAAASATVLFQPKQKLNQTKQIRKYIFMENIFYQLGSNSHPEGMRHYSWDSFNVCVQLSLKHF